MTTSELTATRPSTAPPRSSGFAASAGMSMLMPTREEEDAEEEAAEGIDRRLDRAAKLRFREQEPGDEGAERHREPHGRGQEAAADGDEERCGNEELRVLARGDETKERLQSNRADDHDQRDRERRLAERPQRADWRSNSCWPGPRMVTSSSSGTTARSCSSRIEKLARPVAVLRRCWRDRISTTTAVEDSARLRPMIVAAAAS